MPFEPPRNQQSSVMSFFLRTGRRPPGFAGAGTPDDAGSLVGPSRLSLPGIRTRALEPSFFPLPLMWTRFSS